MAGFSSNTFHQDRSLTMATISSTGTRHRSITPVRTPSTSSRLSYYRPGQALFECPPEEEISSELNRGYSETDWVSGHQVTALPGMNPPEVEFSQLFVLVQEQRGMLKQLFNGQEELKKRQSAAEKKISKIEEKYQSSSSSSGNSEKKKRLCKDLMDRVSTVYECLTNQFNFQESSTTKYNSSVKAEIVKQVSASPGCTYSLIEVKAAVQRKYESLRRNYHLEEKENSEEIVMEANNRKKYRSCRQRKYTNRSTVLVNEEEKTMWNSLDWRYMTEESDVANELTDDEGSITVHPLLWRSEELNKLVKLLDERYEKRVRKEGGLFVKKNRILGEPSSSSPALSPEWAVDAEYKQLSETSDTIPVHSVTTYTPFL